MAQIKHYERGVCNKQRSPNAAETAITREEGGTYSHEHALEGRNGTKSHHSSHSGAQWGGSRRETHVKCIGGGSRARDHASSCVPSTRCMSEKQMRGADRGLRMAITVSSIPLTSTGACKKERRFGGAIRTSFCFTFPFSRFGALCTFILTRSFAMYPSLVPRSWYCPSPVPPSPPRAFARLLLPPSRVGGGYTTCDHHTAYPSALSSREGGGGGERGEVK